MFIQQVSELLINDNKPFQSCHASHLTLLSDGTVLVAWFAGSKEGEDDNAIWYSRRLDGVWVPPTELANEQNVPYWNPVLLNTGEGLVIFYKVGQSIKDWMTLLKNSTDDGLSWSAPSELVADDRGGRGPVRNKVIILSDGSWLAPASTEDGIWTAFVDRSEDQGLTWNRSRDIGIPGLDETQITAVQSDIPVSEQSFHGKGVIQPSLWESTSSHVHMLLRSSEGYIYRSDSSDGGFTWCDAYATDIPNNNSGIDVVKMDSGLLVLCCNPVGANWGPRTPLVLMVSHDNGLTWSTEVTLEQGEGEYSYPAIIAQGNDIYLTYTWNRENIAFRRFNWT